MSHVETSPIAVGDLDCLRKVVEEYFPKLKWMNQKTYKWFGKWMNDYHGENAAYKQGIDPKDYGKCDFALHMDGVNYEIGIVKRKDGTGYSLVWDFFRDGRNLSEYIGKSGEKLLTKYAEEFTRQFSQQEGYMMNRTEDSEFVFLELSK